MWITADLVGAVLHFFAELSTEPVMKDWLGEAEGNIFWPSLLTLLCNAPVQTTTVPQQAGSKSEVYSVHIVKDTIKLYFNYLPSLHDKVSMKLEEVIEMSIIKPPKSKIKSFMVLSNLSALPEV